MKIYKIKDTTFLAYHNNFYAATNNSIFRLDDKPILLWKDTEVRPFPIHWENFIIDADSVIFEFNFNYYEKRQSIRITKDEAIKEDGKTYKIYNLYKDHAFILDKDKNFAILNANDYSKKLLEIFGYDLPDATDIVIVNKETKEVKMFELERNDVITAKIDLFGFTVAVANDETVFVIDLE